MFSDEHHNQLSEPRQAAVFFVSSCTLFHDFSWFFYFLVHPFLAFSVNQHGDFLLNLLGNQLQDKGIVLGKGSQKVPKPEKLDHDIRSEVWW